MLIKDLSDLDAFVFDFFKHIKAGDVFLLDGPMGVGKTTFVRSFMNLLDFKETSSPTFSLIQEYKTFPPVFHIDLYRCESVESVEFLDLDRYLNQSDHVVFVEWPKRWNDYPPHTKRVSFKLLENGCREIFVEGFMEA